PLIANAADVTTTESVTVHKLLAKEGKTLLEIQNALKDKYVGSDKYLEGEQEKEIKDLYTNVATQIKGVYFAWQKEFTEYKKNEKGVLVDKDGSVIKENITEYNQLSSEEQKKAVPVKVWKYIAKNGKSEAAIQDPSAKGFADGVFGGETEADGHKFDTTVLDQSKPTTYKIVEIHSLSSYKGEDGKVLTDKLAVPVEITLPLVNEKGVVKDAHVYPKNTEDKPQIDKNFDKEKNGNVNGITKDDLTTETKEKSLDINLENNKADKPTAVKSVGQSVPYKVVTEIPAQTKWATAKWDDKMTEGLTYNQNSLSIELKKGENKIDLVAPKENNGKSTIDNPTKEQPESDYTISQDNNGFVLEFTKTGLKKLNDKPEKQTVTLKYTAKVNDKSVVKVPESNDITFHYGNNPGHGNTPVPNKPGDNGVLKATKTWADGKWAENEKAKFKLVDANTGKDITADDLVEPAEPSKKADFEAYKKSFDEKVKEQEIGYGATTEAVWKYLDKNREYKVVETSVTYTDKEGKVQTLTGWEAEYAAKNKGTTTINNYLTNNPTPLNPSEPKVVTYGAKFVKTNVEGERLKDAEFVVKNAEGKFLVEGTKANRTDYENAQNAYVEAIKAWNKAVEDNNKKQGAEKLSDDKLFATINGEKVTGKENVLKVVAKLEKARDAAWNATLENMDGFTADKKDAKGVLKLKSNELGQFEIAGLKDGSYTLVEVKAPDDYVDATKATLEFGFTIGKDGEQSDKNIDFGIDDNKTADNAMKIVNKKVSIPQTGGIGTIIFTAIGLAIMASAVIAIKKRQATEAR
ncbi:pilin N-terminal domain-containing protein, partial [Finegoldia magna]|uniref:pilin N-terminal domain-containing protein n=1 Tax=Finegoldia magna TaxID=1260 RepID=UPI0007640FF3